MLRKPFADLRIPVRGIVVDDRVDRLSLGNVRVDLIEEADEFLMPMAIHVAADNGAVEDIEGGAWSCRCACSRASSFRRDPASSAVPAGCDREPGFGRRRPCSPRLAKFYDSLSDKRDSSRPTGPSA
jgi:hypothetical protein